MFIINNTELMEYINSNNHFNHFIYIEVLIEKYPNRKY